MGAFNQDKGVQKAPSFGQAPRIQPLDLGSILGNIGETVGNVVQETDTNNKQAITDTMRKAYELDNKIYGVDAAATMESPVKTAETMGTDTPPVLKSAVKTLTNLQAGYQQGTVKESNYYSRLSAVMRELRAKYPGYDDQIDQIASRMVGENPDHAVRKHLMREAESAGTLAQKQQDKLEAYFNTPEAQAIGARKRYLQGEDITKLKIEADEWSAKDSQMKREAAKISLRKQMGEEVEQDAEKALRASAATIQLTDLGPKMAELGFTDMNSVQRWMSKAMEDGKLDSEELKVIGTLKQEMMAKYNERFNSLLDFRASPDHKSLREILPTEKIKTAREGVFADYDEFFKSLESGKVSPLMMAKTQAELMQQNDELAILKARPEFRNLKAVTGIGGNQAGAVLFERDPALLQSLTTPQGRGHMLGILGIATSTPNASLKDVVQTPQDYSLEKGTAEKSMMAAAKVLTSGKLKPEEVDNVASTLFGKNSRDWLPNYIAGKSTSERRYFINTLTSPEMTQYMTSIRQTNPTAFKNYFDFVSKSVPGLVKIEAQNLQNLHTTTGATHSVKYENGQLVVTQEYQGQRLPPPGNTPESLEVINGALQAVRGLYKANGQDPDLALRFFMDNAGLDLTKGKDPTLWQSISKTISDKWNDFLSPQDSTKDSLKKATPQKNGGLQDPFANEMGYAPIERTSAWRNSGLNAIERNMGPVSGDVSYDDRLKTIRTSTFGNELKDPLVKQALYAITEAEVGGYKPEDHKAFIESVLNRAASRKMTLDQVLGDTRYFPSSTFKNGSSSFKDPKLEEKYGSILEEVMKGSNLSRYATGNASGRVMFAGGPQTYQSVERFGQEGPDKEWVSQFDTYKGEWSKDTSLTKPVRDNLSKAQAELPFPITIRSGHRSPDENSRAGGAHGSEHLGGNAVDIDLRGLSDEQRTQLVSTLVKSGFNRLGAYSGNTGLHVDMKPMRQEDGSPWPMFDRSRVNMGKAPSWFTKGLRQGWSQMADTSGGDDGTSGLLDSKYYTPTNSGSPPTTVGALGDRWVDEGRPSTNIEDRRKEIRRIWDELSDQEKAQMMEDLFPVK